MSWKASRLSSIFIIIVDTLHLLKPAEVSEHRLSHDMCRCTWLLGIMAVSQRIACGLGMHHGEVTPISGVKSSSTLHVNLTIALSRYPLLVL